MVSFLDEFLILALTLSLAGIYLASCCAGRVIRLTLPAPTGISVTDRLRVMVLLYVTLFRFE